MMDVSAIGPKELSLAGGSSLSHTAIIVLTEFL